MIYFPSDTDESQAKLRKKAKKHVEKAWTKEQLKDNEADVLVSVLEGLDRMNADCPYSPDNLKIEMQEKCGLDPETAEQFYSRGSSMWTWAMIRFDDHIARLRKQVKAELKALRKAK